MYSQYSIYTIAKKAVDNSTAFLLFIQLCFKIFPFSSRIFRFPYTS
nr:MAG TPA: hypothetical protein [Bacteriophage sp.]